MAVHVSTTETKLCSNKEWGPGNSYRGEGDGGLPPPIENFPLNQHKQGGFKA